MTETMFLVNKWIEFKKDFWERWLYMPLKNLIWEMGFHSVGAFIWWECVISMAWCVIKCLM